MTPREGVVEVRGIPLHYVDHGGSGPPMVFLAGLGNTAYVFDEFAPRFRDRFHVYAFTRRGFGASGHPREGYDTAGLAEDVCALMDSLRIGRAVLVGHSVAGDELTWIASAHPERVQSLVYLDAAYDRSHTKQRLLGMVFLGQLPPVPPSPNGRDRRTRAGVQSYLERIRGVRWPMREVEATNEFDAAGRWKRTRNSARVNGGILRGEAPPRYRQIVSPSLCLYSTGRGVAGDFPWVRHLFVGRGVAELKASRFEAAQSRWERSERERVRRELPGARVIELAGANHYLFLSHPERIEAEMRTFLDGAR